MVFSGVKRQTSIARETKGLHDDLVVCCPFDHFHSPLVQAFASSDGGYRRVSVGFRVKAQHESAREVLMRVGTLLLAHRKKDAQGNLTLAHESFYIGSVEIGSPIQPHKLTTEQGNLRFEGDNRFESVDGHYVDHGYTPCSSPVLGNTCMQFDTETIDDLQYSVVARLSSMR